MGSEDFYASTVYGDYVIPPKSTILISTNQSDERISTSLDSTDHDKTTVLSHASIKMK